MAIRQMENNRWKMGRGKQGARYAIYHCEMDSRELRVDPPAGWEYIKYDALVRETKTGSHCHGVHIGVWHR